jgi:EAL domain-containing protein (putative c-di-GMP-specific phosphodiesterase class I)
VAALRISVNVSALQFARPDFVDTVMGALSEHGLPGEWLQLELTESAIVENATEAAAKLQRLRALGVRLALDDFGTGYSSLGYLRSLPVDCIKIDQTFLAEVETSQGATTIVEMIVSLAHSMGLTVVAEGVETEHQLALLQRARCDMAQGHLLGAALGIEETLRWMAA